jgi:hypothetical protein
VRVAFDPPRTIVAVRGDADTITFDRVGTLFGTVKAVRADTVLIGMTSAATGGTGEGVSAGTTARIVREPGVDIAIISRHPRRVELTILGALVAGVTALVLIGLALGNAAT